MSIKRQGFKLSTLSLAIMATVNFNAIAEEAETKKAKKTVKEAVEVIEVTGFRGSVMKSLNAKRFSDNVSDNIYAEDIGKSTDQNIADALSRVTGVSVQSVDGEGTKITVRGANPNQNVITINGVTMTSSDENQSVDLSTFSSDILSSISVVKTPSADHDEGSLGASIQLNTTKPLDINREIKTLTLQGRYNDFSENEDYKISGTFSKKFADETFGVLVSAFDETSSVRRDQLDMGKYEVRDVRIARDLDGNIITDTQALTPNDTKYSLFQNERNRHGATLTLQYAPTDNTSINFDYIYSKQETFTSNDSITARTIASIDNYVEGEVHDELSRTIQVNGANQTVKYAPDFTDPQEDWWTIDSDNQTLVKSVNRFADGGYGRQVGSDSTINNVINLTLEHYITDDFKVDLGVNYSKTELTPDESTLIVNLTGGKYGKQYATEFGTPHTGIQPAGFDCTSGTCQIVSAEQGLLSQQDPFQQFDGLTSTAFNADDISSFGTNQVKVRDRSVDDEQKTAFIDFDWDVDFFGITKVEFGVKASERTKFVDFQEGDFGSAGNAVEVPTYDRNGNITGARTIEPGQSLGAIDPNNYLSGKDLPYNNFMVDLGVPLTSVTDGWPLISASTLLGLANDNENLVYESDPSNSRETTLKNQAAYFKVNFEPMDNLTGNVGVRWVKTEVEASGFSGVQFWDGDAHNRNYDPFLFAQLRNDLNAPCDIDKFVPNDNYAQSGRQNRIDGLGWDQNGTPNDFSDDVRFEGAATYPCYDPETERSGIGQWAVSRHADVVVSDQYWWGDVPGVMENRSLHVFETKDVHEYDIFLPSLNLNYQLNDDMIVRFAASKTMSRPPIDNLKPGFKITEGVWGAPLSTKGNVSLGGTKLNPEESNNLDISFEWYFNEAGMVSVALFNKDMSNFIATENLVSNIEDLRYVDTSNGYDVANLLLTEEQVLANFEDPAAIDGVGKAACFPDRASTGALKQDWFYSDNMLDWCKKMSVTTARNGAGQTIRGVELSYNQTYDFLPGIFAGLGSQFSYTYTDSETEAETSSLNEDIILQALPAAWTPKHSYNATLFWEQNGHQIRLAYRGKSDELNNDFIDGGHVWREGRDTFDFSANYKLSQSTLVSFQVINLTDEVTRDYFTSNTLVVNGDTFDEGNALEGGVNKSRTERVSKTGRTFRLGVRVNF